MTVATATEFLTSEVLGTEIKKINYNLDGFPRY